MIISHKYKFVFVAIPKTGTHTIREALRPQLGQHDWEQCSLFVKKTFPMKHVANVGHGHFSFKELQKVLRPPFWEQYYKFCFVRDPYDRFISLCYFWNRYNQKMQQQPLLTMKKALGDPAFMGSVLCRPQAEFIVNENGEIMADFIGKTSQVQDAFDLLSKKLSIDKTVLGNRNTSPRGFNSITQKDFDLELIDMIDHVYRKDQLLIERYDPVSVAPSPPTFP